MSTTKIEQLDEIQKKATEAKERRRQVWQETYQYILENTDLITSYAHITKYIENPVAQKKINETVICVMNEDCLYAAKQILDTHPDAQGAIAVINMSDMNKPGGGYAKGDGAQEEELIRRTTLYVSLTQAEKAGAYTDGSEYRLNEFDTIYSENVTVLKSGRDPIDHKAGYNLLKELFKINVVSSAAYNLEKSAYSILLKTTGRVDNHGYPIYERKTVEELNSSEKELFEEYKNKTKIKIRQQLRTALIHGNEYFVLSAFGCGAFYNDPEVMSQLYKEVLNEDEFKHAFKMIAFAIFPNPGQSDKNFQVFKSRFGENSILAAETKKHAEPDYPHTNSSSFFLKSNPLLQEKGSDLIQQLRICK